MRSTIQDDTSKCFLCGKPADGGEHHIFGGSRRQISEKLGLKVGLCYEHHLGNTGAHKSRITDLYLKLKAQSVFIERHGEEAFRKEMGRIWTEEELEDLVANKR